MGAFLFVRRDCPVPIFAGLAAAALLLAACAMREADTPAQRLYALQGEFNVIQRAVLAYVSRPPCAPPDVVVACADPKMSARLRASVVLAKDGLDGARRGLDAAGGGDGAETSLAVAAGAVKRLAATLARAEARP